jgi:hypothetical protein
MFVQYSTRKISLVHELPLKQTVEKPATSLTQELGAGTGDKEFKNPKIMACVQEGQKVSREVLKTLKAIAVKERSIDKIGNVLQHDINSLILQHKYVI